ncbi:MAG: biopolymer transporter ExbD [Bdellovibrionaceae bacterium]|nr:biopolymer transporter ExbD [Pseudobdellovibrionaceae bacterium]
MSENQQSFELNLMPVISLLAVCISFLLITSVWIHIGSLDVSQAVGTESNNKVQANINVTFENEGMLFQVKDSSLISSKIFKIKTQNDSIDWNKINSYTQKIVGKDSSLKMALIMPATNSKYQDIVKLIDTLKSNGINDVGIAPL